MYTPDWVGFDGEKGVKISAHQRFRILRGGTDTPPWQLADRDFKEMLVWWTPPNKPRRLLWCGPDGSWYNVYFSPVDNGT